MDALLVLPVSLGPSNKCELAVNPLAAMVLPFCASCFPRPQLCSVNLEESASSDHIRTDMRIDSVLTKPAWNLGRVGFLGFPEPRAARAALLP